MDREQFIKVMTGAKLTDLTQGCSIFTPPWPGEKSLEVHFFKRLTGAYGGGQGGQRPDPELEQYRWDPPGWRTGFQFSRARHRRYPLDRPVRFQVWWQTSPTWSKTMAFTPLK